MRRFKLIGRSFPKWLKDRTVYVTNVTEYDYYIPEHKQRVSIVSEWEVLDLTFNEYLKLIKQ